MGFYSDSLICRRDTRGWVMPKHLDFKKREKVEKTHTFSCNVRKFLGTQPPTKESILSLRRLLLQKKNCYSKDEKYYLIFAEFIIKQFNLRRNLYILLTFSLISTFNKTFLRIHCFGGGLNIPPFLTPNPLSSWRSGAQQLTPPSLRVVSSAKKSKK